MSLSELEFIMYKVDSRIALHNFQILICPFPYKTGMWNWILRLLSSLIINCEWYSDQHNNLFTAAPPP